MRFCEKLDLLMNITKTSNSALGQKVRLDPSHISRLRRGQRNAIKDEAVIDAMAEYFARNCTLDYQRKGLLSALNTSATGFDFSKLPALIAGWLGSEKKDEIRTVGNFLHGLTSVQTDLKEIKNLPVLYTGGSIPDTPPVKVAVYYGVEGKQKASELFLMRVIAQNKPRTIFLYSDEPIDWMTENPAFARRWAELMMRAISQGNKIKIIHTVSRDLDEILCAMRQWIPLYMSGAIEPYYYPKKKDGVFKKTLFIAPDVLAVVSNSVAGMTANVANILYKDKIAIAAFAEEFCQYLSMCKPLMRIFTGADKKAYLETLMEFEKGKCNSMIKTESLSLLTMPKCVLAGILSRIGMAEPFLMEYQEQRRKNFEEKLQTNTFYEIIAMPDLEAIKNNKIKVSFSDIMNGGSVYYTKQEYIEHLEYLVRMLKTFENFHIKLMKRISESNYMVYAKEDLWAIVAKTSSPPVILAIDEINLTTAFWDFLCDIIGERDCRCPNNQREARKLNEFIRQIKSI